ncbi:ESX secretion-associated protein EspG [Nocardia sp. NBC_00403]|uniref:ESX secretion-associated protein EspG n=1 Tax=Nocardia sp. NBC_00403 TaxID=2975990 RepID=UPI002E1BF166
MSRIWKFTDLEFVVLWEQMREDVMPRPFVFTTDIPLEEDYQRELHRIRERLRYTIDPAVPQLMMDIARPDLSVLVRGIDGKNPDNPEGSIRMIAARREDRGYLLTQLPGRTVHHSEGFTITECDVLRLADVVVAALPKAPAGKQNRVTLRVPPDHDGMDHGYGESGLWDSHEDTDDAHSQRFLTTVPATVGGIEVCQGISRFGPRGRVARYLEWRDLPDDGRYVITQDTPPIAIPVDAKQLTAQINAEITFVVRAIRDDRT